MIFSLIRSELMMSLLGFLFHKLMLSISVVYQFSISQHEIMAVSAFRISSHEIGVNCRCL